VIRFTDYDPLSDAESFFYNVLLQHIPFRDESELFSTTNTRHSYILECKLRGLLDNVDSLFHYVQEYSQRNLYDEDKHDHLVDQILLQHPYLDPDYIGDIRCGTNIPMADDMQTFNISCFKHDFSLEMENAHLNDEQQQIFDNISNIDSGLYFTEGTPGSGKTFFIKYLTNHLIQTTKKKILLCAPTGAAATRLSSNASTIHGLFRLPIKGPLYTLQQPNLSLQRLQAVDVIIVDKMSMMTIVQSIAIYSRLKQVSEYNSNPFHSKIFLCVGNMAQLPFICSHTVTDSKPVCRRCCIINSPIWISGKHFTLINSVRHSKDPEYLHFLNIIRKRRPTEEEIQ
jgi:Cdc6-like AAA superfamily ATPase